MACNIIQQSENIKKTKGRIDIIEIANSLGIKVFSTEEISVPSIIAYNKKDNCYEIYVNKKEKNTRKRFSIAHEIAHFIQHRDKIVEYGVVGRQNSCSLSIAEENDADKLAAEILMPQQCIKDYLTQNNIEQDTKIDLPIIKQVAEEFEVSILSVIMRLRELGYYVGYIELN